MTFEAGSEGKALGGVGQTSSGDKLGEMIRPRSNAKPNIPLESKLDQFSSCFKTEADLRSALVALLEKMPYTSGVKHTHGPLERGKDIIFRSGGPFGREELVACIVKNSPITGSVDSDDGARTVYHQAEQSLDTPIANSRGEDEYVSRSFIVTPYECTQAAIDSIKGKLADGRVDFIYGRDLYELFEKHYPEYLVFRSGLFGSYIKDLEAKSSQDSAVANLLLKHGLPGKNHDVSKIYVQPTLQVNISEYHLMTEWPQIPSEKDRITEQDALHLANRYSAFGRLIDLIAEENEKGALGKPMRWLANALIDLWKSAYKAYPRESQSLYRSEQLGRKRVALHLPGVLSLSEQFNQRAGPAKSTYEHFLEMLQRANDLAASQPANYADLLAHPANHDYSYVRGIAAQLPYLVSEAVLSTVTTSNTAIMDSGVDTLITAPAGFGKSSFCRWNVLNDLKALKEERSNIVPVLIPLHQSSLEATSNKEDLFFSAGGLAEMWSKRRSSDGDVLVRRFRLYLDGLDEVPDLKRQRRILSLARELKDVEPTTHIIVTGREHVVGSHLGGISRVHVAAMSDEQVVELIDQWFADSEDKKCAFLQQVELLPSMKEVIKVPLLATLVLSVYEGTSTLPESKIRLYDMFISLMAGGWDIAKRVHKENQFGAQPKITVLQYLAGRMQVNESREASTSQFNMAVKTLLPALDSRSPDLLDEILHDGLLVPVANGYAFAHLSFQEYLAAKDLLEPRATRAAEALGRYLRGSDWWKEVLSFYVAISGQPKEMELFVRAEALKVARKSSDRHILVRTVGLLKEIAIAYPGARPDLEFPQWPKTATS